MTLHAFDGADPTFNLTAAKNHGGIVCSVYIVGSPGGMAHADAARVRAIRAAGMGVLPNWERAADFFGTCSIADARAAGVEAAAACRALGIPADMTVGVAFSFDFEVPANRFPEMLAKLKACQAGMGATYKAVAYAQSELIEYMAANGMPGPHWLMMSTFGHPYHSDSPHVFMWQQVGGSPVASTDVSIVTHPFKVPAWWPDGSPYGAKPVTPDPTPNTPSADGDLPTSGDWATRWTNPETKVKRSAAEWLVRIVNLLIDIQADVKAIRKKLDA